jgi:serine protease Do
MEDNWNESTSPQRQYGHYEVDEPVWAGKMLDKVEPPHKKKNQKPFARRMMEILVLAIAFGLVAGGVALGVFSLGSNKILTRLEKMEASVSQTQDVTLKVSNDDDTSADSVIAETGTVAGVAQAAMPSVVAITSVSIQEIPIFFGYGGTREYSSTGSGSGIIVGENDTELLIATNNHVVDGAQTLSVCFIGNDVVDAEEETSSLASGDGDINVENAVTAKIKGTDEDNDLAVVSVEKADIPEETMKQIKIAQIGSSDDLIVGEQVVAIGNALGYGQSVTSGWISALNRSVSMESGVTAELIQTDAAINPGNSGGALLNMKGELIGINSAKYADETVEGMGYAIPISKAQPILEELMNRQTREIVDEEDAAYLGIKAADLSSEAISMYNMPAGAFIIEVTPGEAADTAGIRKGDIIVKLDGQKVSGKEDLLDKLQYYAAGEEIEIVIERASNGEYVEVPLQVTMGKRP